MSTWCWNFGFDWNAPVHLVGSRYLPCGFVDVEGIHATQKDTLPAGTPYDVKVGQTLCFHFFNLTAGATLADDYTLTPTFEFRNAKTHALEPLLVEGSTFSGAPVKQPNLEWSAIFSASKLGVHPSFPYFSLADDGKYTIKPEADKKRFLMTVLLKVVKNSDPDKERIFFIDPEMVVGGMS